MPATGKQTIRPLRRTIAVLLGLALSRRFRMLPQLHVAGGARVSRAVRGALLLVLLTAGATRTNVQASQTELQPALGDCVRAFLTARQWIDDFNVPSTDNDAASLDIAGAAGAHVALRHTGRVVGAGTDTTGEALGLRRAVGKSLSELLGDESMRNIPESLRDAVGGRLNLELEVAGPLQPLLARTTQQVAQRYEPGLDGLAMRRGDGLAMLFPAQMRRTGNADNIDAALGRLAAQLGLRPAPLDQLIDRRNVSLYRFRTLHLVQSQPDASPRATHRGLRIVGVGEVTPESIRAFADAAAEHLINKLWTGDEPLGLLGDYDSLRDAYQPMFASPRDQALAAYALALYAGRSTSEPTAERARSAAEAIMRDLAVIDRTEADPFDDIAACALLLAGAAPNTNADADLVSALDRAQRTLASIAQLQGDDLHATLRDVDPTTRGMIAAALQSDRFDTSVAQRVLNACFDVTSDDELVAMMPWAYLAELHSPVADATYVDRRDEYRDMRLALWSRQVKQPAAPRINTPDNTDWLDLTGGFALATESSSMRIRPTAQSTRAVALLAIMLSDESLTTGANRAIARQNQRLAMRYLMQLQITEADVWAFRNPDRALGGIRSNTWSADLPTAATAMALLAAVFTEQALDEAPPAPDVREPASTAPDRP